MKPEDFNIKKYKVNSDLSIDVDQDVTFCSHPNLYELPFKFNQVNGKFCVFQTPLKSFKNFPKILTGYLNVEDSLIENFDDFNTESVYPMCYFNDNLHIKCLKGLPSELKELTLQNCNLTSDHFKNLNKVIDYKLIISDNNLLELDLSSILFGASCKISGRKSNIHSVINVPYCGYADFNNNHISSIKNIKGRKINLYKNNLNHIDLNDLDYQTKELTIRGNPFNNEDCIKALKKSGIKVNAFNEIISEINNRLKRDILLETL